MTKLLLVCALLSVATFQFGCAKKEKEFTYTTVDKRFEQMRNQQLQVSQQQSLESLDNNPQAISEKIAPVVSGACKMINERSFTNPFEFEKYFSSDQRYNDYLQYVDLLVKLEAKCLDYRVVYDLYPIILVEYNLENSPSVYIPYRVNKDLRVKSLYPFFENNFKINYHDVAMSDGKTLSTISFEQTDKKAKTVLIKTPYFHTDSNAYYFYMALVWLESGHNVVIQSNRGSHASTGEFKWLHEKNVSDSKESISWIRNQEFSNGKIISYGVSYDGFNALASAIGDPEGLESVIACSAPANASTDSFTAGQTVEGWLIQYIANRENPDEIKYFNEKVVHMISNNIPFEDYDNHLYGRDLGDWNDLMKAKSEGSLSKYFKERSLLEGLSKTKTPIFHIAGTNNDQDSRDTVLAYEYVKENDTEPTNHRLYIHHEGHGCGNFVQAEIGQKFIAGEYDSLEQEYKMSSVAKEIFKKDNEVFYKRDLGLRAFDSSLSKLTLSDRYDNDTQKQIFLGFQAQEDLLVNGVMKLEIEAIWDMFNSNVTASVYYTENGTTQRTHYMMDNSTRSSFYLDRKVDTPTKLSLTLPPSLFSVAKEQYIYVVLTTNATDYFDIFMNQRSEYYSLDETRGTFRLFDGGNNKLIINGEALSAPLKSRPELNLDLEEELEEVEEELLTKVVEEVIEEKVEEVESDTQSDVL
jgi:hypothetical protein